MVIHQFYNLTVVRRYGTTKNECGRLKYFITLGCCSPTGQLTFFTTILLQEFINLIRSMFSPTSHLKWFWSPPRIFIKLIRSLFNFIFHSKWFWSPLREFIKLIQSLFNLVFSFKVILKPSTGIYKPYTKLV